MSTVPQAVFARGRVAGWLAAAGVLVLLGGVVPARAASPVHQITLVMKEFKFEPAAINMKAGQGNLFSSG